MSKIKDSFSKEIFKRLMEAQHLAELQLEKSETDLAWEKEWEGREFKTSDAFRKYKTDLLLVERIKKTIETLSESAAYREQKGYLN